MKKIMFLILLLCTLFISGCIEQEPPIPDDVLADIYYLNDKIVEYEDKVVKKEDLEDLKQILSIYENLDSQYYDYLYNINILKNAYSSAKALDEEDMLIVKSLAELKTKLLDLIPARTYDNMSLPQTTYINDEEVDIFWTSSDIKTVYSNGMVINGREEKSIVVKGEIKYRGYVANIEKSVIIEPIKFKELQGNNVFTYMYSGSYNNDYTESDLKTIDVVNLCFADIINGEVDILSLGMINNILTKRRDGIRVCICITGYGSETKAFSDAASTSEGRVKLAKSIVNAIEEYHFDGIDIDWEYPGSYRPVSQDRRNHALFMEELYRQVKSANSDYIVSGALPSSSSNNGLISRYDMSTLVNCMDYIHLMTYDMNSSSVSSHHTSFLGTINTINTYLNNGAKPSQLTAGIAFYGKQFRLKGDGVLNERCGNRVTVPFDTIYTYKTSKNTSKFITYWDDYYQAPYMEIRYFDSDNNYLYHDFITYDDERSVKLKCQYAMTNQLAGVMCWEYGENKNQQLQQVIYEVLKEK